LQEVRRDFVDEARGVEEDDATVALTTNFGRTKEKVVFGASDGDVKESPLFGVAGFFHSFSAREHAFAEEQHKDNFEFRLMDGAKTNRIGGNGVVSCVAFCI